LLNPHQVSAPSHFGLNASAFEIHRGRREATVVRHIT